MTRQKGKKEVLHRARSKRLTIFFLSSVMSSNIISSICTDIIFKPSQIFTFPLCNFMLVTYELFDLSILLLP